MSYAELIGDHEFDLSFPIQRPLKTRRNTRSLARQRRSGRRSPKIVTASLEFTQDVRLPGMLHARSVRPTVAGATLVSVDGFNGGNASRGGESALQGQLCSGRREDGMAGHPGGARIEGDLEKAGGAVVPHGYDAMYDYLAKTPPQNVSTPLKADDIEAALASAAHTITATYQSAFQSHASMTPGCCVADVKDGGATVGSVDRSPIA